MARKHRRRTRKRGGSVKAKLLDGFKELQNVGKNTLRKGKEFREFIKFFQKSFRWKILFFIII